MKPDILASSEKRPDSILRKYAIKNPVFVCVISYTATSEISGLTVAGANPELVQYTPAADAEFLYYGYCKCISSPPATPDGKPTPAIITRTALKLANIPVFVVDAGAKVRPSIPLVSLGVKPGSNITINRAMHPDSVRQAFDYGVILGKEMAKISDTIVVGESIPGGTTTAMAVLTALGVQANFKLSSSMPRNPHELKNKVVSAALKRAGVEPGTLESPFEAISQFGDPMMPAVGGIVAGALSAGRRVMLAGGTQMTAVLAILKYQGGPLDGLCIGTTSYVTSDPSSDLYGLVRQIVEVPVLSCNLHLDESVKPGLRAFAEGFVKEGVGAGGSSIVAMLKSSRITGRKLMKAIEKEYELSIEVPGKNMDNVTG